MRSISLTPGGTVLETIEERVRAISWARLMPICLLDFSDGIRMPEPKVAGLWIVEKSQRLIIQRVLCGFTRSRDFLSYSFRGRNGLHNSVMTISHVPTSVLVRRTCDQLPASQM